jgi:hypothetical protein
MSEDARLMATALNFFSTEAARLRPHAQVSRTPCLARLNNRNRLALVEKSLAKAHGGKTKDIPKANPAKIFNGIFPILILIRFCGKVRFLRRGSGP